MSTIECKAMVLREVGKPMQVETIQVAPPEAGEVRVKVLFSSCCHTDLLVMSGQDPETPVAADNGVILGHESFGVVEAVGEGVTNVKVGDHVIPTYIPQCNECKFCQSPKTNLCQKIRVTQGRGVMPNGTVRYKDSEGRDIRHFMGISGFSQYIVTAAISVCKVDDSALEFGNKLPIVGCGFTTGYGTVKKSGLQAGESIAIIGLGGVGLAGVLAASKIGAKKIIAIDVNPEKFALAKKLGATDCINPKDYDKPIQQVIIEMTEGWGVDYAVECVGNVELMKACLEMVIKGWGKAIIVGVATGKTIDGVKSFYYVSGRSMTGAAYGNVKPSELPAMVDDIVKGELNLDDFITNSRPMAEINEAFNDMHAGKTIRTIINMWE